jgi:hypothetical protein
VFVKPGGDFVAAQATGGDVEHQTFLHIDRRLDLTAVKHKERFHRGVPDALVAIQKRVVSNEGEAQRGSLVRQREVEIDAVKARSRLCQRGIESTEVADTRYAARPLDD